MRYALVTGSSRGIGLAIADKLTDSGYTVFRNGRSMKVDPLYIQADLSKLDGVESLGDAVLNRTKSLDCLVLNAGATCRKPLAETEYDDWQLVIDTNMSMPFFLIKRLFENISDGGSVIFISSAMALKPHAASVSYGVTKAAVNMMAQCLVKEFAPRGIRVNVICPGFIDTQWQKEKPDWLRTKIEGKISLGRFGMPEEVADLCLHMIENNYFNGAIVSLDGGYDMQ